MKVAAPRRLPGTLTLPFHSDHVLPFTRLACFSCTLTEVWICIWHNFSPILVFLVKTGYIIEKKKKLWIKELILIYQSNIFQLFYVCCLRLLSFSYKICDFTLITNGATPYNNQIFIINIDKSVTICHKYWQFTWMNKWTEVLNWFIKCSGHFGFLVFQTTKRTYLKLFNRNKNSNGNWIENLYFV